MVGRGNADTDPDKIMTEVESMFKGFFGKESGNEQKQKQGQVNQQPKQSQPNQQQPQRKVWQQT